MDIQLKRGMLDVCVLAAIKDEDSYGYQIIKDMKPYVTVSESTLYPILRRLEANAYLTVQSVEHNGRLRKYYHITDAGRARIDEFQEEWKELESIYRFIVREEPMKEAQDHEYPGIFVGNPGADSEDADGRYGAVHRLLQ